MFLQKIFSLVPASTVVVLLLFSVSPRAEAQGGAAAEFDAALRTWNLHFAPEVRALSWATIGALGDEATRRRAVNYYVRRSYFPTGDVGDSMAVARIDSVLIPAEEIDAFRATVDSILSIGDSVARVRFERGDGTRFKAFVVHDDDHIQFDTLLMNSQIPAGTTLGTGADDTFHYEVSHLWGVTTTTFDAWVKAVGCQPQGPPSCLHECHAVPGFLGKADIKCKVETIGRCCVLTINYAWATGFKKIRVAAGGGGLQIVGGLGRSGTGSATRVSCCP